MQGKNGVCTEVQHGGRVAAGSVVGHQVDLSLSLLLLHSLFGLAVSIGTAAAEQDQYTPQEPKPCDTHTHTDQVTDPADFK